jgi:hypothetical protein
MTARLQYPGGLFFYIAMGKGLKKGDIGMKFKIMTIVTLLLLTVATACWGKEVGFTDSKAAKTYCEAVMNLMANAQNKEAFDLIETQWTYAAAEVQKAREQSEKEQAVVKERFGQPVGFKLVKEEEVPGIGLRVTYVILYEKNPVRWQFIFYKAKDRWLLNSFKWDTAIDALFEK